MAKTKTTRTRLTTSIGWLLDRTSYLKIGIIICCVIVFNAIYFVLLNPYEHGTNVKSLNFFDSLYFSIITFSSLGYGDIAPIGFGKAIASLEVISGLILIAVFVGKLASERQSALLLLIYTSEHQRRLIEFEKDIYDLDEEINSALDDHNHDKVFEKSGKAYNFISSIYNYLRFQANQGGLASFGNTSALRRLYQAISKIQATSYDAFRTAGVQKRSQSKFEQLIERSSTVGEIMSAFHLQDATTLAILAEIQTGITNLKKWKVLSETGNATLKYRSGVTEALLEKVKKSLPSPPWEKNIHKKIATELGIHNSLSHQCVNILVEQGHWPELQKPKANE